MRALFDNLLSAPVKEKEKKRASQQELLIFQVTVKGESALRCALRRPVAPSPRFRSRLMAAFADGARRHRL